jgi:large subunit ribosomal protein L24
MIKNGTEVKIMTGKDKGKKGQVIEIIRSQNKAKVKGINFIKKHEKTTKEKKGGIISKENFIHMSNLKVLDKPEKKVKSGDKK